MVTDGDFAEFMEDINASNKLIIHASPALLNSKNHAIPDEIRYLYRIHGVDITGCGLENYGNSLQYLSNLHVLSLEDNKFTSLPPISGLGFLNMIANKITELPTNILKKYGSLYYLYLRQNDIKSIPEHLVKYLPRLNSLHLQDNKISSLPSDLAELPLEQLGIWGNPIKRLPLSLCEKIGEGELELIGYDPNRVNPASDSTIIGTVSLSQNISDPTAAEMEQLMKNCRSEEIAAMAPMIKYKPGGKWLRDELMGSWRNKNPKEFYNFVLEDIRQPNKKLRSQEWQVICSQIGEMRKDELLDILLDLGLEGYVRSRMTKAQLCDIARRYLQAFKSDIPTYHH